MPRNEDGLTVFQERLLDSYVAQSIKGRPSGKQAALDAGSLCHPDNARIRASQTLAKPHVKAALEKKMENIRKDKEVEIEALFQDLSELIEMSMGRKETTGTGTTRADVASAKSLLELKGRAFALWTDKVVHEVSDAELIADFQQEMSKRIAPSDVEAILTAVEERILARR